MGVQVVALPAQTRLLFDARGADRSLRVSRHDEAGVVVLSLWRDDRCVGTCRLAPDDVRDLLHTLVDDLAELPGNHAIDVPRLSEVR